MIMGEQAICLSGGAAGADQQWGMCAGQRGDQVIHWSFKGHKAAVPKEEIVELTDEQLREADPFLLRANETLKRRVPFDKPWIANLLRRNFYQIRDTMSVYAVASLERGQVTGGTAWATQMFIDRFDGAACPAYVYDQKTGLWHVWDGHWSPIETPPVPKDVWTGIGSRELLTNGKQAIRTLLNYQPTSSDTAC